VRWGIKLFAALSAVLCVAPMGASAAVPANDSFANRELLGGPLPIEVTRSNVEATREWQHEEVGSFAAGHSVWFKWTASVDGFVTVDACTASFASVLGIFTGPDVEHLTRVTKGNASEGPRCAATGRTFTFKAVSGTEYAIGVDGNGFWLPGSEPAVTEGQFTLQLEQTPPPINDNFADAALLTGEIAEEPGGSRRYFGKVTGHNWKATTEVGEPLGADSGASVWYSWTPPETADYRFLSACCQSGLSLTLFTGGSVGELSPKLTSPGNPEARLIAGTQYRIAVYGRPDAETGEPSMGSFNLLVTASLSPRPQQEEASSSTSSPTDATPPQTFLNRVVLKRQPPIFIFRFASSEAGSTFRCSLDRKPFKPCGTSKTFKRPIPGRHRLRVFAVDRAGNADPSPAVGRFGFPPRPRHSGR
jgi:hypothetical protein